MVFVSPPRPCPLLSHSGQRGKIASCYGALLSALSKREGGRERVVGKIAAFRALEDEGEGQVSELQA